MKALDVAVVGGGVIGAACARALAARGLSVAVFEPGPEPGAASPASAGMLAAQIEPGDDVWLLSLSVRGRDLYETLAPALRESTGIDVGFWRGGIASVAFDEAAVERLQHIVAQERQASLRCDWLEPADVHDRWPGAAPDCAGALFAPEDGAVDPQALTRACLADARRLGGTVVATGVERITTDGGAITGLVTAQGPVAARHVVVAAGAWSVRLGGLPRPLFVEPVRGQLATPAWPAGTPPAILYADHGYILARGGQAILGSTMEHAGFDAAVTNDGQAQILQRAKRLLPSLAALPVVKRWAGLRPMTPDARPIVGPDPEVQGLWYATGHGRNGVLLAALTGEIIAELIAAGHTDIDIEPMQPRVLTPGP